MFTPKCFVIMPFGNSSEQHKADYWTAHFNNFIKPAIEEASEGSTRLGYQVELANPPGGNIIDNVLKNLQEAEVVLVELTDHRHNVLYELAIRHALYGRTIMIIEKGQEIPFYLGNYKVIEYTRDVEGLRDFKEHTQRRLIQLKHHQLDVSDNPVFDYFHRTQQRVEVHSNQTQDMPSLRKEGFTNIYSPETNELRNRRKQQAMRDARQHINLLASSGRAYLAKGGSYFRGVLEERLRAKVPIRMILVNPWSESRVLMALGELSGNTTLTPIQMQASQYFQKGNLTGFNAVELIEQSTYYRDKHDPSIRGYKDLKNQSQFSDNIELRICTHAAHATMLLTESTGFFEPYLPVNLHERFLHQMISFELEFPSRNYFYTHCTAYFETLWNLSTEYEKFAETEDYWKEQLREKYERKTYPPSSPA